MQGVVGDIGGTNARFALATLEDGRATVREPLALPTKDYPSPEAAIQAYLQRVAPASPPQFIVAAVAGPVTAGKAHMTNLDWELSEDGLKARAGFRGARLINDFTAQTLGAVRLGADGLRRIGPPVEGDPHAAIAVMGPGTGFGAGVLVRDGGREVVLATEGGHISFAPSDDVEIEVLRRLQARFGHVSVERILSGKGLHDLYVALCDIGGRKAVCPDERQVQASAEAGDADAVAAVERFALILGSVAGDLTLATGARGGVYIAGGVAHKLQAYVAAGGFRSRFEAKGRFQAYLAAIPTWLIIDDYTALIGAASVLKEFEAP